MPSNPEEFRKLVEGIKADTPVDAVVLRKGKKETIKGLSLPEAKAVQRAGLSGRRYRASPAWASGLRPGGRLPDPAALPGMLPLGVGNDG